MFTESMLFLLLFLLLGLIAKNNSLIIAVAAVILLKLFHVDGKVMEMIQAKGINWGVTIITVAILIPIATGQIGFKDLIDSFKSAAGWIGLGAGIAVSILAKKGVGYMAVDPQVTVSLVFGTILAVVLFRGIAAGPVIAAGIAYMAMQLVAFIK
ncbi:DUF441 domain-containing protein [Listeria marthii]|uniref:UPF0756 membrane protein HCX62_06455 n=4 Tax=Listeria TaxID=1637 RepID=A0A7X1A109_9LIST|nr:MULTISPECIES: DUF441 domain-containing protein [Listeria]EFR87602.1 YtwI [Listeria marthii FSL S4-120]MBC1970397.1 DUF441 domain-containing protein [Listeria marthii]MBC1977885.1 DUF441 domain-containing protein [Listeria marthii]MBC1996894.1 DUF441 domain-containing protein [Listeria marthii]MBC2001693.1 DUF441 domain-containing protein [Listeria marthii]